MNEAWNRLKEAWNENPTATIGVLSIATLAVARMMHEVTLAKNARTYRLETERRYRKR